MNKVKKILVLNLGSTSSMISVFENDVEILGLSITHTMDDIKKYPDIDAQYLFRKRLVKSSLEEAHIDSSTFDAIAVRGLGAPGRYHAGAYVVDERLAKDARKGNHMGMAIGAILGEDLSKEFGIPAYLYDVVFTDEFSDVARISGSPLIERTGSVHTLNTRAVARQVAEEMGKSYESSTMILCHLGGGISTSLHKNGRIIDGLATDEGTFTPDRSGRLPLKKFAKLCTEGQYNAKAVTSIYTGNAGLIGYLGINDCREIEKRINAGDEKADLIYRAMAYQVAQDIGAMSAAAKGEIDAIILTGGIAYSELFTNWIKEYVGFIAPIEIRPGSMEMCALAQGILRVLEGKEEAHQYIWGETVL